MIRRLCSNRRSFVEKVAYLFFTVNIFVSLAPPSLGKAIASLPVLDPSETHARTLIPLYVALVCGLQSVRERMPMILDQTTLWGIQTLISCGTVVRQHRPCGKKGFLGSRPQIIWPATRSKETPLGNLIKTSIKSIYYSNKVRLEFWRPRQRPRSFQLKDRGSALQRASFFEPCGSGPKFFRQSHWHIPGYD